MGLRGPPPTPQKVLEMRGSWRAKEIAKTGVQVDPVIPERPKWLTSKVSKAAWKHITRMLGNARIIAELDQTALGRYCVLLEQWLTCKEWIDKHGMVHGVKGADGALQGVEEWPQFAMEVKLSTLLGKLEAQFGLTPSARARISVGVTPQKDEAAEKKKKYFTDAG
jgi:P27 family predicted phage terminase small subunit